VGTEAITLPCRRVGSPSRPSLRRILPLHVRRAKTQIDHLSGQFALARLSPVWAVGNPARGRPRGARPLLRMRPNRHILIRGLAHLDQAPLRRGR
jgi:hypothetical protein